MKKLIASILLTSAATATQASDFADKCKHITDFLENFKCVIDAADSLPRPRFSDENLKKNIATVDSPLDKISQLNGVNFEWKNPNETDIEHLPQGKDIGVIAQDVEKVFPELVHNVKIIDKNGTEVTLKQVNYAGLVGVLIESIKELKKDNEALRQQLGL
ncbi:tail fiber domain-containing protein [Spartinivicinus ruber]|uniref:tail fiber domain-containing protein n=1 Tax=Spartinivicinus ruber TaxID=2683272 RepID=UPI0013D84C95|nr:tail fiber domain-containing protein [Spartinivicinus ruber]